MRRDLPTRDALDLAEQLLLRPTHTPPADLARLERRERAWASREEPEIRRAMECAVWRRLERRA